MEEYSLGSWEIAAAWLSVENICCGGRPPLSHDDLGSTIASSFCNNWTPSWTVSAPAEFKTKKYKRGKISKCAAVPLFKDRMIMLGNMPRLKARRKQLAASKYRLPMIELARTMAHIGQRRCSRQIAVVSNKY